jgi:hypothetical protein
MAYEASFGYRFFFVAVAEITEIVSAYRIVRRVWSWRVDQVLSQIESTFGACSIDSQGSL